MFKITNERAGDSRYSGITERNHVSQLIVSLVKPERYYGKTTITRLVSRSSTNSIIQFDINGNTYWCKLEEYEVVKLALTMSKSYIELKYVAGSIAPLNNIPTFNASGLDGYEVHLKFD